MTTPYGPPTTDRTFKGNFLWAGIGIWGPVFWIGMNALMFLKHQQPKPWSDLIARLLVTFAGSECLGIIVGFSMWAQARAKWRC